MAQTSDYYASEFFSEQVQRSGASARVVLSLLYRLYQPNSVIDIGCGLGAWLGVAESLGSSVLRGLDGPWISQDHLVTKAIDFTPVDLEGPFNVHTKYDLCISVEVAEHLSKDRAESFVSTLCDASDIVLFSAAIKRQGGTNHLNEQWQSYWVQLFNSQTYDCYDLIRPVIWNNSNVDWWYRQNTFLFVRRDSKHPLLQRIGSATAQIPDLVHPVNYELKLKHYEQTLRDLKNELQQPTAAFTAACIKRLIHRKIKSRWSRKV